VEIYQLSISKNLIQSYNNYLNDLRQDALSDDDTSLLSEDFILEFKKMIKSEDLDSYTPKSFYWLNLIDQLVDTLDVAEGMLEGELAVEDAIDFLEGSEFLGLFLESDTDPEQNMKDIIEIQELQVVSYFWLHINTHSSWEPKGPVAYRPIIELGEGAGTLFLGKNHNAYKYPNDSFQDVLPVIAYLPQSESIVFDGEDETIESSLQEKSKLTYFYSNKEISVIGDLSHKEKFDNAFMKLEDYHPKLYEFIFNFTNTIVPIKDDGIISYSMDTLPGHSCINTFDRDFIDLLDDLVHESGHHYLNAMIEGEDNLINEDDDKIFYSPWRKALRPIRGLYHAVGTFFWAFELFKDLRLHEDKFSKAELGKIHQRFCEEGHMILMSHDQIEKGLTLNKITPFGHKFIISMIDYVKKHSSDLEKSKEYLKENHKDIFEELKVFNQGIEDAQRKYH